MIESDASVISIVQGCPLLEELDLGDSLNDEVLVAMGESCRYLKSIRVRQCYEQTATFTDQGLIALSQGCPYLELHFYAANSITGEAILCFAEHCYKLECVMLTDNDLITTDAMCSLIKANPGITSMVLRNCNLDGDQVVSALARYCVKLETLSMLGPQLLSEAALLALVTRCHALDYLLISPSHSDISDAFVDAMMQQCRRLRRVYFGGCPNLTEKSVTSLLTDGKYLTEIRLFDCDLSETDSISRHYTLTRNGSGLCVDLQRQHRRFPWFWPPDPEDILIEESLSFRARIAVIISPVRVIVLVAGVLFLIANQLSTRVPSSTAPYL